MDPISLGLILWLTAKWAKKKGYDFELPSANMHSLESDQQPIVINHLHQELHLHQHDHWNDSED